MREALFFFPQVKDHQAEGWRSKKVDSDGRWITPSPKWSRAELDASARSKKLEMCGFRAFVTDKAADAGQDSEGSDRVTVMLPV